MVCAGIARLKNKNRKKYLRIIVLLLLNGRKQQGKGCAIAYFRIDKNMPLVTLDNIGHSKQTQSGAGSALFGGKKRVEYLVLNLRWNANTIVTDGYQYIAIFGQPGIQRTFFPGGDIGLGCKGNLTLFFDGFFGIHQHVYQSLFDLAGVAVYLHLPLIKGALKVDAIRDHRFEQIVGLEQDGVLL
jgi:hypothetical protein